MQTMLMDNIVHILFTALHSMHHEDRKRKIQIELYMRVHYILKYINAELTFIGKTNQSFEKLLAKVAIGLLSAQKYLMSLGRCVYFKGVYVECGDFKVRSARFMLQ